MQTCDILVVGGGIAGAAVAAACARRGASVVLVEAGVPPAGASAAAAGMLAPCSEAEGPGPFLDAARASLAAWPAVAASLVEATGVDVGLRLEGLVRIAVDENDAAGLAAAVAARRAEGVDCRLVDAAEVARLEPAAAAAPRGGAWFPGEGHVDSPVAVRALVAQARAAGAEVLTGTRPVGRHGDTVTVEGDAAGTVAAAWTVVAAGARSDAVSQRLGGPPLPVTPVRGQLIALQAPGPSPRRVLFAGRSGYAVAKPDGRLLVGATEEDAGFDLTPDAAATARLRSVAAALVRGAGTGPAVPWVGLRPGTPDRLPLLGAVGPGLAVATGHHRNGVLLAPLTGASMAGVLLDGRTDPLILPFDPARVVVATPARHTS